MVLGATNALNGDKIIPIKPLRGGGEVKLDIHYIHGGGLGSLRVDDAQGNLLT
jgi:hypothetical protein